MGGTDQYQGITLGFSKNYNVWPAPYTQTTRLKDLFNMGRYDNLGNDSLLKALGYEGGNTTKGAAQNMLRAGVAALLNASAYPKINYYFDKNTVLGKVNDALARTIAATYFRLLPSITRQNNYENASYP